MPTASSSPALFPSETDPEHIAGRGFDVTLSTNALQIVDEDASVPPPLVLRSVWGRAVRTSRDAWPYDFQPLLYSGVQLWAERTLGVPELLGSTFPSDCFGHGQGAYVASDEAPAPYDSMEFVFVRNAWPRSMPDEVYMAWVVLDPVPTTLDPFAVAASRVLDPLISTLRSTVDQVEARQVPVIEDLSRQVERLSATVRGLRARPTGTRRAISTSLLALLGIVLSIVANRVDPVVDRIDWPPIYDAIQEVIGRLALN